MRLSNASEKANQQSAKTKKLTARNKPPPSGIKYGTLTRCKETDRDSLANSLKKMSMKRRGMVAELMASNSVIETSQKNSLVQEKHLQNSSTLGHRLDRLNDQRQEQQNQLPQILLGSAGDQASSMDESDQIYYQKSNGKPSVSSSRQQLYPPVKLSQFPQQPMASARSASASEWPF